MATEIGTIKTLIGTATAKTADGTQRILQTGDVVYQNDIIVTGEFGAIEIELTDGSLIDLGRNTEAVLDPSILNIADTSNDDNDITALQQVIIDGEDPTQVADPTAAGAAGNETGNEGTNIVQVKHLAPETTPESGFDSPTGTNIFFPEEIEESGGVPGSEQSDTNLIAINTAIAANEAGLATGNDATSGSATVAGQLAVAGEGVSYAFSPGNTGAGNNGTLTLNSNGSYSYTLTSPVNSGPTQGTNIVNGVEVFNYTATDSNGNATTGTITINVIDDVPMITLDQGSDTAYSFTVTNHDEVSSAGYHSSYGYYIKDNDGNPTTGTIIWDDVHDNDTAPVSILGHSPDQIGFFIIPNGDNNNASLTDNTNVTFQFVNGQWQAFDAGQPIIGNGSHVLFDNAVLNKDNQDHIQDNALIGNQNWEDLQIPNGDGDYNDVNVNVEWTTITVTGDSIGTASFGADGPGSIDFTIEEVTILGDLTSNGKNITFEARDSDNDGYNDLIIGSTEDGDVLSIDGILDTDDYELQLFAPIESSNNGTGDVQITANLNITDSDGDNALATLNLNLDISLDSLIVEPPSPPNDLA